MLLITGLKNTLLNTRVWNGNIHSYKSKESSNATNSKQRDIFFPLFLNSQGPIAEHYQDRSTTLWDTWQTQASSSKQMLRPTVKRYTCIAVPYIHCCPHCRNPPHSPDEAPLDSRHFGSPRDALHRPSIWQWPRSEGISSCEACQSAKNVFFFFPQCIHRLIYHWTK